MSGILLFVRRGWARKVSWGVAIRPARVLGVAAAAALAAAAVVRAAEDEAVRGDLSRFEGAWRVVAIEANGERGDDRRAIVVTYDVDGNWLLAVDGAAGSRGLIRIDPLAAPKEIDVSISEGDGKGTTLRGIYEVDDKTLRLCLRGEQGWRPREFASRDGAVMLSFERQE